MRFVWLDVPGGGEIPVNPDQVAYLRTGQGAEHEGKTEVVFGAVNGGLHSVIVQGDGRDIAEQLAAGGRWIEGLLHPGPHHPRPGEGKSEIPAEVKVMIKAPARVYSRPRRAPRAK